MYGGWREGWIVTPEDLRRGGRKKCILLDLLPIPPSIRESCFLMKILSKYSLHVRQANRTQNDIAGCQNFYSFNSSKSLNFGGIVLDKGKQLHADYEMS